MKVQSKRFHLNGNTIGFHLQTPKNQFFSHEIPSLTKVMPCQMSCHHCLYGNLINFEFNEMHGHAFTSGYLDH